MADDTKRLSEIQDKLVKHIQKELLKHSMVLYKTFLEDDQIKDMLKHVGDTLSDDLHNANKYFDMDDSDGGPTVH